ncbi:hypothetical protein VCNHCC008D_001361 [Vibrio cholerae O1 str. NHCC-008D]|nr:hypothetical protein VCNHCC008D_001361 [Vibrio cholerae O1 str. NHCC-008D]
MVFLIRCHSKCGIVAKRAELDQSFMLPFCESHDSPIYSMTLCSK